MRKNITVMHKHTGVLLALLIFPLLVAAQEVVISIPNSVMNFGLSKEYSADPDLAVMNYIIHFGKNGFISKIENDFAKYLPFQNPITINEANGTIQLEKSEYLSDEGKKILQNAAITVGRGAIEYHGFGLETFSDTAFRIEYLNEGPAIFLAKDYKLLVQPGGFIESGNSFDGGSSTIKLAKNELIQLYNGRENTRYLFLEEGMVVRISTNIAAKDLPPDWIYMSNSEVRIHSNGCIPSNNAIIAMTNYIILLSYFPPLAHIMVPSLFNSVLRNRGGD